MLLKRIFDPRFLTVLACWFIAAAILDYETPKAFNILCSLATLAPFAVFYWLWALPFRHP
jgi:hypothetical protein